MRLMIFINCLNVYQQLKNEKLNFEKLLEKFKKKSMKILNKIVFPEQQKVFINLELIV